MVEFVRIRRNFDLQKYISYYEIQEIEKRLKNMGFFMNLEFVDDGLIMYFANTEEAFKFREMFLNRILADETIIPFGEHLPPQYVSLESTVEENQIYVLSSPEHYPTWARKVFALILTAGKENKKS